MKNVNDFKEFKDKRNNPSLNETVLRMDDVYRVRTSVDMPASLVNAYIKKVKDESGKNIREFYSDMELAEMLTDYIKTTYLNIENFPVAVALGTETSTSAQVQPKAQGQVQEPVVQETPQTQVQEPVQNVQAQSTASDVPAQEGGVQTAQTPQTAQTQSPQSTQAI